MSDNKTTETKSESVCKGGVCFLSPPELESTENPSVTVNVADVTSKSTSNPNGPTESEIPQEQKNIDQESSGFDLQNLFTNTLQNLHNALAQGAAANVSLKEDDDLYATEDENEDDWEESDIEEKRSRYHRGSNRKWRAFQDLLESHNSLCHSFEKLLNDSDSDSDTDGEDTDGESSDSHDSEHSDSDSD